jgi:hypothetical protein
MSDEIREANLELLIGLKQHLDQAAKLGALLERLLSLARRESPRKQQGSGSDDNRGRLGS